MADPIRIHMDIPPEAAVVLDRLAKERGLTRAAVIRQAVGVLQAMHDGAKDGYLTGLTKDRQAMDTLLVAPL